VLSGNELMVAQNLVAHSANATAKVGELLKMTATATVTLPAVANNAILGVICASGETTIKAAGSAKIYGDFITGSETIKLLLNQHVILQSDGTNWYILAGEPKREGANGVQTSRETGVEYEVSANRLALVTIAVQLAEKTGIQFIAGGVVVGEVENKNTL